MLSVVRTFKRVSGRHDVQASSACKTTTRQNGLVQGVLCISRPGLANTHFHKAAAAAATTGGSVSTTLPDKKPSRLRVRVWAWITCSVAYHIITKELLTILPMPWLVASLQLAVSAAAMAAMWVTSTLPSPDLPRGFWKALLPVAALHVLVHVATVIAFSRLPVSFVHVLKCGEPMFTMALSGERFLLQ
jgi:drug/metabolite transporter (DMT)-like permease